MIIYIIMQLFRKSRYFGINLNKMYFVKSNSETPNSVRCCTQGPIFCLEERKKLMKRYNICAMLNAN